MDLWLRPHWPGIAKGVQAGPGDARRMGRVITWVAAVIAIIVATIVPAAYIGMCWNFEKVDAELSARQYATIVTQAAAASVGDWRRDVPGLVDTPLREPQTRISEHREVRDLQGRLVTESADAVLPPQIVARAPLVGRDGVFGEVVLHRSMRSLLFEAGAVAAMAATVGLAIYFSLRIPMRVLGHTLGVLHAEQQKSHRVLERQLDVLFEQAADGMLVFDADGLVRSCNPEASRLLGLASADMIGQPLARWIRPPAGTSPTAALPLGKWEADLQPVTTLGSLAAHKPVEISVHALTEADEVQFFCLMRDISERRLAEQHMTRLAKFDSLTGLPNRSLFRERLQQAMARAQRHDRQVALMFLDLDRFKTVNDSLGHHVGDLLLQHVAQSLRNCLRETDEVDVVDAADIGCTISRLGGDEFTVILEDIDSAQQAAAAARRILGALRTPFSGAGQEIVVSTSIGITMYPADASPLDELIKHADMAMYRAKEQGRNGYQFYSEQFNTEAARRLQLESGLRHALERDEFELYYQPRADLISGAVTGVEALLRWRRSDGTIVSPDQFIGVLEDTGLIVRVGRWVLHSALLQLRAWQEQGLPLLSMSVNLSARQFRDSGLVASVKGALDRSGVQAEWLELELTESMLMDGETHRHTLDQLAEAGVRVAIDDFGTGYSSLSYLKRLRVDTLKVDRSFVQGLPDNPEDAAISTAVIALGRSLGLRVVAEGVETRAQRSFLRRQGCDEIQGYLLSRPVPPDVFATWWRAALERRAEGLATQF